MKKNRNRPVPKKTRVSIGQLIGAAVGIFCLLFLVHLVSVSARALQKARYFTVKTILCREGFNDDFAYLTGRSIFSIDLKQEARKAALLFPSYKKVTLIKVFPDKIFVDIKKRKPLALVDLPTPVCIDDEYMLFEAAPEALAAGLPTLVTNQSQLSQVRYGTVARLPAVVAAVEVMRRLPLVRSLRQYRLQTVDLRESGVVSCFFARVDARETSAAPEKAQAKNNVEVKIGYEELQSKIGILSDVLAQHKEKLDELQYIDLRFKDPVIKLRNSVKKNTTGK